ncbi:hypothetical protein ES332_D01G162400v1 [Gossypium tomentosum]|uniref:Uncharacterized protein n=1 Tax=Gossypium tomentosum TaxID=34277 RepID=A0A5D2M9Y3_GOSTO|nr:hypothetical protein ES332_D01G162400v1 [Gossypium tomentosum]
MPDISIKEKKEKSYKPYFLKIWRVFKFLSRNPPKSGRLGRRLRSHGQWLASHEDVPDQRVEVRSKAKSLERGNKEKKRSLALP